MKENLTYIKHVLTKQEQNMEKVMEILKAMKADMKNPENITKVATRAKSQISKKKSKSGDEAHV